MTAGDVYKAPWGTYVVLREGVLRDVGRANAFIVNPGPEYVVTGETMLVGSDSVSLRADPKNGAVSEGVGRPHLPVETNDGAVEKQGSASPHGAIGQSVAAVNSGGKPDDVAPWAKALADLERALPPLSPIPVNLVLGAVAPGGPRVILRDTAVWMPCLSRELDAAGAPMADEHAWFISHGGTMYCPECRAGKPLAVVGPTVVIDLIRAALDGGEIERAHDLVRIARSADWMRLIREAADEIVADLIEEPVVRAATEITPASAIPPAGTSLLPTARSTVGDNPAPAILPGGSSSSTPAGIKGTQDVDNPTPESSGAGALGDDGSPRTLPQRDAKATAAPDEADAPFVRPDDPKESVGDFSRPPRPRFKTIEEWKEYAAERSAIRQYGLEDHHTPGARERADAFARELAGPPPRKVA